MKNVFSRAFTNLSGLFTPPSLRKRARVDDQQDTVSELPAPKAARIHSNTPLSARDNFTANGFAPHLDRAGSNLPLSRPAVSPLASPERLDLQKGPSQQQQQQQQQLQFQVVRNRQSHSALPTASRHTAAKRATPLSKVTYQADTPSAFGSNFSIEGSGLKLLHDEPGSVWQRPASGHKENQIQRQAQGNPIKVSK